MLELKLLFSFVQLLVTKSYSLHRVNSLESLVSEKNTTRRLFVHLLLGLPLLFCHYAKTACFNSLSSCILHVTEEVH